MKSPGKLTILAVYPERQSHLVFDRMPPLGMAWIAAVIRDAGFEVRLIDEQVDRGSAAKLAEEMKPSLVLLGGTSHTRFEAFARAADMKAAYPPSLVVYGGPHASFTATDTLANIKTIDIVVHGEGEGIVLELARWRESGGDCKELSEIRGISFRVDGDVHTTDRRPFNRDLDLLPLPARDLLPMDRYGMKLDYLGLPAMHIMTARGCPFACSFCSASKMFGRMYAMRSPSLVVDEIETLVVRYGMKGLKIFDSTFTTNRRHVMDFCDELERRGLVMPWECEVRVGTVDRTLLERMQRTGCYYIDVGIESGDHHILEQMGKGIELEEAERLLSLCHEMGIRTKAFFTVGHIGETLEAGRRTIDFIKRNRKHITLIGYNPGIRIYPGTQVEDYAREHDLFPAGFRWSHPYENRDCLKLYLPVDNVPLLLQPQMGIQELRKLRQRYILSRIYSLEFWTFKLRLLLKHRELMKYVTTGIRGLLGRRPKRGRNEGPSPGGVDTENN